MTSRRRWFGLLLGVALVLGGPGLRAQEPQVPDAPAAGAADSIADPVAPVEADRAAADARIEADLQSALDRIPELAGVEASVEAGVVRLDGTVIGSESREEAEGLARAFEGVLFVVNRITETTSLGERLRPTTQRLYDFGLGAVAQAPLYLVAILIVLVSWIVGRWMRTWKLPAFITTRNAFVQGLMQRMLQTVVVLFGIGVALQLLDAIALAGALAGTAGIAGLAVGFAFKDIVENYLAGILLSLRNPFEVNDHVVVDGHEGKVVRLTWRNAILMTLDGNHLALPNGRVFGSVILNYTRNPKRRFSFELGVGSSDDLYEAQRAGRETLKGMKAVADDPEPEALVMEVGDSTVTLRFLGWIDQSVSDLARTRSEAIRLVKQALEEAGVTLPSPEYNIVLDRDRPAPTGERPGRPEPTVGEQNTAVDRTVEEQVLEDRAKSGEEDLLAEDRGPDAR